MDKYIKAEDVKDLLNGLDSLPWEDEVEDMVDRLITDNVVEVVRCKDCNGYDKHRRHCNYCGSLVFDDDFCSHGKRKEGAE